MELKTDVFRAQIQPPYFISASSQEDHDEWVHLLTTKVASLLSLLRHQLSHHFT